jgi:hypothetical protein
MGLFLWAGRRGRYKKIPASVEIPGLQACVSGLSYLIAARAVLNSTRKPYTQPNNTQPITVNLKRTLLLVGRAWSSSSCFIGEYLVDYKMFGFSWIGYS